MGLTATLDTIALTDILQWIDGARKTGILRVTRGKANVMFHFTGGRLTGGASNDPPMLLGQFLLSRGKITEQTLHEALEQQDTNRRPLGDILLDIGAVTADELERACVAKAEETIFGMLEWTDAVVEFDPQARPGPRMVRMDHSVEDLLLQSATRQDEMARLRELFSDPGMVLYHIGDAPPPNADDRSLAARIHRAVDGKRTLAEIILHARTSDYQAMRMLFDWHRQGAIGIKHVQEVAPRSGTPEASCNLARRMIRQGDHEMALEVLGNALHSHPENRALTELLAETEAQFLDEAYRNELPKTAVPVCFTRREELLQAPGNAATELFLFDSIEQGRRDVKALVRLLPVHEVDVVRALLHLKGNGYIELRDRPQGEAVDDVNPDELQEMLRDIDTPDVVEESIDKALG